MELNTKERKITSRFVIFIRTKETQDCDSITYWKSYLQGGCYVGRTDTEREAIDAAIRLYRNYNDSRPDKSKPISFHIVDLETCELILSGGNHAIKDYRKRFNSTRKIPENIEQVNMTYKNGKIQIDYKGD